MQGDEVLCVQLLEFTHQLAKEGGGLGLHPGGGLGAQLTEHTLHPSPAAAHLFLGGLVVKGDGAGLAAFYKQQKGYFIASVIQCTSDIVGHHGQHSLATMSTEI